MVLHFPRDCSLLRVPQNRERSNEVEWNVGNVSFGFDNRMYESFDQLKALTLWKRVFENRSCNKYNSIESTG